VDNINENFQTWQPDQNAELKDEQNETVNGLPQAQPEDQFFLPTGKSRNHTAMILLGTCMISMLAVYLFGLSQKPSEASAQEQAAEQQVTTALAKLVHETENANARNLFNDTDEMVQAFYEYPSSQQVALNELRKNPFSRFSERGSNDAGDDEAKPRIVREKELNRKLLQLELQSILHGTAGARCLINGEIFSNGQQVLDSFRIKDINVDTVILAADDLEFVLQM